MKFKNKKTGETVEWDCTLINSALLSAQNRQRLYWANWKFEQPEDKKIYLKDIIEHGEVDREKSYTIDENYFKGGNPRSCFEDGRRQLVFAHQSQKRAMVKVKTIPHGYVKEEIREREKYPALAAQDPSSKYLIQDKEYRKLTVLECEHLQTVEPGYTSGVSNTQRYKMLGNGWTVDVIVHIFKALPH
jgi:DNA (cytosine-5)-methyltransferase 1